MANVTGTALKVTDALNAWAGAIAAFQPLLAAGMVLGADLIALFKKSNPGATNDELNVVLLALVDAGDKERIEIAKERAAAVAEIAGRG